MTHTKQVRLSYRGDPFRVTIPDNDLARNVLVEILNGSSYPLVDNLTDVRTIVDVGANVGIATLYFHTIYPDAEIHCYEPSPSALPLLRKNTQHLPQCTVHPVALYDCETRLPLRSGMMDCVQDSLCSPATTLPLSLASDSTGVPVKHAGKELAPLTPIDILKLDTEGCEALIMGALQQLLRHIRVLYLETHSPLLRRTCEQILDATHTLYRGSQHSNYRGQWLYLRHDTYREICDRDEEIL